MLLLGCSFTGADAPNLHHVEAIVGVSLSALGFNGLVRLLGLIAMISKRSWSIFTIFVSLMCRITLKLCPRHSMRKVASLLHWRPMGKANRASLEVIESCGRDLLKHDPYALVYKSCLISSLLKGGNLSCMLALDDPIFQLERVARNLSPAYSD